MVSNARDHAITTFLDENGYGEYQRIAIPADASFRRYERLEKANTRYILMDAPPPQENIRPFIKIDEYLCSIGLSAPKILARDEEQGFLILEDFGNDSYSRLLKNDTAESTEKKLYTRAIDALLHLHQSHDVPTDLPPYNDAVLEREILLFIDWYLAHTSNYQQQDITALRNEFLAIWYKLFPYAHEGDKVVVLRDYHADNLMWLSERDKAQAVGQLDFQDALHGSPAYDLVSLLEDARRDVSPATQSAMLDYFIEQHNDMDATAFKRAYATLGAQRNCKIIGIFCRLTIRDGKARYLSYIPRVWKHLEHDLSHPDLLELKQWIDRVIPPSQRHVDNIIIPQEHAAHA